MTDILLRVNIDYRDLASVTVDHVSGSAGRHRSEPAGASRTPAIDATSRSVTSNCCVACCRRA